MVLLPLFVFIIKRMVGVQVCQVQVGVHCSMISLVVVLLLSKG